MATSWEKHDSVQRAVSYTHLPKMTAKASISRVGPAGGGLQAPSLDRLEEHGIVGAGGGGFPTAVKLKTTVSMVIANAAECEPLLHKDKELLHHHAEPFLRGMKMAMDLVGAREGVVGIKEKYHEIIAALEAQVPAGVRVQPLPDCYPAGDEFILVHMVTGRVIPPGGLPKDVDTVVSNVETLMNIALDKPVTHKYLTVAGAVETPVTLRVPIGITIGEVIEAAGGTTVEDFGVLIGGVMTVSYTHLSMTHNPVRSLRASLCIESTLSTWRMFISFRIL